MSEQLKKALLEANNIAVELLQTRADVVLLWQEATKYPAHPLIDEIERVFKNLRRDQKMVDMLDRHAPFNPIGQAPRK